MFKRFYKNVENDLCEKFVNKATSLNVEFSPAQIQGHLLIFKNDPQKAISKLEDLLIKKNNSSK